MLETVVLIFLSECIMHTFISTIKRELKSLSLMHYYLQTTTFSGAKYNVGVAGYEFSKRNGSISISNPSGLPNTRYSNPRTRHSNPIKRHIFLGHIEIDVGVQVKLLGEVKI